MVSLETLNKPAQFIQDNGGWAPRTIPRISVFPTLVYYFPLGKQLAVGPWLDRYLQEDLHKGWLDVASDWFHNDRSARDVAVAIFFPLPFRVESLNLSDRAARLAIQSNEGIMGESSASWLAR